MNNSIIDSTAETLVTAKQAEQGVLEVQIHLHCSQFKRFEQSAMVEAVQCGMLLTQLKPLIAHGGFEAYVQETFGIDRNRASQWMRLGAEYGEALMGQMQPVLPPYSQAVALLEGRGDSPALLAVKQKTKQAITVDGETFTVKQIQELKKKAAIADNSAQFIQETESALAIAIDAGKEKDREIEDIRTTFNNRLAREVADKLAVETNKLDGVVEQKAKDLAASYIDELNVHHNKLLGQLKEKEDAIASLQKDLSELYTNGGSAEQKKAITDFEKRVEALVEQAREKQQELANLDVKLFNARDLRDKTDQFNLALTRMSLTLDKDIGACRLEIEKIAKTYIGIDQTDENKARLETVAEHTFDLALQLLAMVSPDLDKATAIFDKIKAARATLFDNTP
ncbi:DUF3102 domain-containing protein [Methylovulum psychrotolerans]|uniref:Uncharacterized protein n=1 Tax=Methylovulum psychrotolerans TaxID=1704499 RepID=A0A2S5CGE9_9GAMM|nr:DUF3102 domain-containing protein [Methylovulum psychrotolerans]POZ49874.1 hypothetical protein AADEFJLK_04320 [Methylovulum psychrotolerans]